jgi:hypothetical protein
MAQQGLEISPPPPTDIVAPPPVAPAQPAPAAPATVAGPLSVYRANQEITIDGFIGSVNAEPIYASDLFRAKDVDDRLTRLAQTARNLPEFERGAREVLRRRIEQLYAEALVLSAAEASLTAEERARIDDYMNGERIRILSSFGGSAAAAEKALSAQGSSLAQEMARRKKAFKKELYFSRNIAHNVEITQQMARDAYDRTPDEWKRKSKTQIYTIRIPISRWLRETLPNGEAGPVISNATPEQVRAAEAEAMKTAQEIVSKLNAGGDFARLATEYDSADIYKVDGGKWKPLVKGTLVDTKWEDYLFSLPAKTLNAPYLDRKADYKESAAWVIKTGEKVEARTVPFEEVQKEIRAQLQEKQIDELRTKKMTELASNAAVEAIDKNLEIAVRAAVNRYATK